MSKGFWKLSVIAVLLAILFCPSTTPMSANVVTSAESSGNEVLTIISYNVHGNEGPETLKLGGITAGDRMLLGWNMQRDINIIGDRAIVAVQEDWRYKGFRLSDLGINLPGLNEVIPSICDGPSNTRQNIALPYQSKFHRPSMNGCDWGIDIPHPALAKFYGWNDGLNLFSDIVFDPSLDRQTWNELEMQVDYGFGTFDLARKGFTKTTMKLADDFEVDVYNLHAAAGEPIFQQLRKGLVNDPVETAKLRARQFNQLTQYIQQHSQGKAIIVLGDTNLHWHDQNSPSHAYDELTFTTFLDSNNLKSACQELGICEKPGWAESWPLPHGVEIDQIMFRGNAQYDFKVNDFYQMNYDISDHEPIVAHLMWGKNLSDDVKTLTGLSIAGADSLPEATTEEYVCVKVFNDDSTEAVAATWTLSEGDAYAHLQEIDSGHARLSANAVDGDKTVAIGCAFEDLGRSMTASKDVQIQDTGELFRLDVEGPGRVANTSFGIYDCVAHWQDGTPESVEAIWTLIEGAEYAELEYYTYPQARLLPKQQVIEEQTVTIQCEFIWAQETKVATKDVVIYPTVGPGNAEVSPDQTVLHKPLNVEAALVTATSDQTLNFVVQGQGVAGLQVRVFNLAGQLVYRSEQINGRMLRWNFLNRFGQRVSNGVYLYAVSVMGFNGEVSLTHIKKLVVLR